MSSAFNYNRAAERFSDADFWIDEKSSADGCDASDVTNVDSDPLHQAFNCWYVSKTSSVEKILKSHGTWLTAIHSFDAFEAGRSSLESSLGFAKQHRHEFVTIERSQLMAILHRIAALESKIQTDITTVVWDKPTSKSQLTKTMETNLATTTTAMFGVSVVVEQKQDADESGHHYQVSIRLKNADPQEVSSKRSEWHDAVAALGFPKSVSDNIRLKVIYE